MSGVMHLFGDVPDFNAKMSGSVVVERHYREQAERRACVRQQAREAARLHQWDYVSRCCLLCGVSYQEFAMNNTECERKGAE